MYNHNDVITHLEPDILECEVKWTLGSITTNKASGADGIPVELFQILKDDLLKCCTQYASKFGKLSSGHRIGKGQFSFQSLRKAMPKNGLTTTQLHSSKFSSVQSLSRVRLFAPHELPKRKKCKSKPHWGTISCQSGWLRTKSLEAITAGEGVEKREPSYTVCGNAN